MPKSAPNACPFEASAPRLFTIDHGRPFLDDLASGLIDSLGRDLPSAQIFFPTRRAVRAAGEAILNAYEKRGVAAALLPRFRAIGDIDEDEDAAFSGDPEDEIDLPPAVSGAERLVLLARMVAARNRLFAGQDNWPAAIAAAKELAKLLDAFHTGEVDVARLREIDVAGSAEHWALSLDFLEIAVSAWPEYLRKTGRIDAAERRAKLISAAARRIALAPPAIPLIIAGTTASAPAVARLVGAISRAPRGLVVLPGLDRSMDKRGWEAIDDAHPQSGLKALLAELKTEPAAVRPWRFSGEPSPRLDLLTLALRPAETTDDWLALVGDLTRTDGALAGATRGLRLVESQNEECEASVIASAFRLTVETPGRTAMLVTPNRQLSRRVALKMRRWGILVDDSAGVPFGHTQRGTFLRLVARFLESPDDPVLILALLRHPLSSFGLDPQASAGAIDAIDLRLRRDRLAGGLDGFRKALISELYADDAQILVVDRLLDAAAAFSPRGETSFAQRLDAHVAGAETIADANALWSDEDGEAAASLIAALRSAAHGVDEIAGGRYSEIFEGLIADAPVRVSSQTHPRLSILGPLEARMQCADLIILGGLNEGEWPAEAERDPFLSRKMRGDLRLLSPERRIGLSAHDFASLASHKDVLLTRAKRSGGKPANPSRWIVRLKNILHGAGSLRAVDESAAWARVIEKLDRPGKLSPQKRPAPKAGPNRRPPEVSVTRLGGWLRDPYSVYARYLLRLSKIDDPGAEFSARDMGSLLHKVYEIAARQETPPTPVSLRSIYDDAAPGFGLRAADRLFWSAAIDESFRWFVEFETERRASGVAAVLEGAGSWTVPDVDPPFTLTARADRIDLLENGGAFLIDYKLGRVPSDKQIRHFSPQLPLTGAIVEAGGFKMIGAHDVAGFAYCRLVGRRDDENENSNIKSGEDARAAIAEAVERLKAFVRSYDDPGAAYVSQPRPEFTHDYGDYDQLARRREWGAAEEVGDGSEE